jgi:hypothetical protein
VNRMTATEALARFYRAQGHAHNSHADYYEARGRESDAEYAETYRQLAQNYFRRAEQVEVQASRGAQ